MLTLATTQVRVQGRSVAPTAKDAHGAPLPALGLPRGPYAAHRRMVTPSNPDTDPNRQQQQATWYVAPEAWPVQVGDTFTDLHDTTVWVVDVVDMVPAGLGLQQVQASCSRADLRASIGWVVLEDGDPLVPSTGANGLADWQVGHGPPAADRPGDDGDLYLDLDTGDYYRKVVG